LATAKQQLARKKEPTISPTAYRSQRLRGSQRLQPSRASTKLWPLQEPCMNLSEITQRLHATREQNQWRRFHSPKNLAMAASVEMAELLEIFQWLSEEQSRQLPAAQLEHAGQEVADVVLYLLLLCSELGIDMEQAVLAKLADNERRFNHA